MLGRKIPDNIEVASYPNLVKVSVSYGGFLGHRTLFRVCKNAVKSVHEFSC